MVGVSRDYPAGEYAPSGVETEGGLRQRYSPITRVILEYQLRGKNYQSAGGGKTYALLITALKFMMVPKSTGIIFRRTRPMLVAPGSIWHEAVNMYSGIFGKSIRIKHRENEIIFDNGSILKFSHMQYEHNAEDHRGAQYSFIAFDEATDFSLTQVMKLQARARNVNVDYKPQVFMCTNPDYNSFLREWIQDFYLDPNTGIPYDDKSNIERYFVNINGEMKWFDRREDAEAIYGTGNDSGIRSFRFIRSSVRQNPYLANSDYLNSLMALPRVQRLIMLDGSWTAREETSGYWSREHVEFIKFAPTVGVKKRVLAVDFAFTAPSEANHDPDYTAFVLMSKDASSVYTVEHVETMQDKVHKVESRLFELAAQVGTDVVISIPQDPNAQAGAYARDLQRRLAEIGFSVKLMKPVKSKLVRFQPFSAVTEARFVRLVEGEWNKRYCDQLELFDGLGKQKDDMVDATSDAFYVLNQGIALPDMVVPSIQRSSSLPHFNINHNITSDSGLKTPGLPKGFIF